MFEVKEKKESGMEYKRRNGKIEEPENKNRNLRDRV